MYGTIYDTHVASRGSRGGGEGGYSWFQVTEMIELGQKSKPEKIPRTFNNTPKLHSLTESKKTQQPNRIS